MRRSASSDRPALRKRLGQHHLREGSLATPMLEFLFAPPAQPRRVLEIGPGGGVLTRELLGRGLEVTALELDPWWAVELGRRLHGAPEFAVAVADALDLHWSRLGRFDAVVGNLPYNVATAILQRALAAAPAGLRMSFLLQLEVAQRVCAGPGDEQHGALGIQVAARAARPPRLLGKVRAGSFVPPPKVESAFVGLELSEGRVPSRRWSAFTELVFAGFSQRRKTLYNALRGRYPAEAVRAGVEAAGIEPRARAEVVSLEQWIALLETLVPDPGPGSALSS